jgi:FdhD protein
MTMTIGAVEVGISRVTEGEISETQDSIAIEEPMEIRLLYQCEGERQQKSVAITMRTPGNDVELALGFLFSEGILSSRNDFRVASHGPLGSKCGSQNLVHIELDDRVTVDLVNLARNFYTTSSCGVCGKKTIQSIAKPNCELRHEISFKVRASLIQQLPQQLRQAQSVFEATGGLHAAALFDFAGGMFLLREDVGRHNALDKLIGRLFLDDQLPANESLLVLSGRASFELIQKASKAGILLVVAIGAPSTAAVQLAKQCNITLIGFAKSERFNIYSVPSRIELSY